jgi:hypothetical protein
VKAFALPAVVFLSGIVPVAQSAGPSLSNLRVRLAAYERHARETGREDPAELERIAGAVIEDARRSATFSVWTEGCGSTVIGPSSECRDRLWAVLNAPRESTSRRAAAAAALMSSGDAAAADALASLLMTAPPSSIAQLAATVEKMPAKRAVPLLVRLSESPDADHQSRACEGLSSFEAPESHATFTRIVDANAPGTPPWLVCMIARARLHEPTPPGAVAGYGSTLQGHGQLFAAKVMLEAGNDAAVQLLVDLTHRGSATDRLAVADLLVDAKPDAAIPVIDESAANPDAGVRATALRLERRLRRPPSKSVRSMLVDADGTVRVRAAEVAIDWARRAQNR